MASLPPHWSCFRTSISIRGCRKSRVGVIIPLKVSCSSESPSSSSSNSLEISPEPKPTKTDAVKIAFAKAKAYKKGLQQQSNPNSQAGEVIQVKPVDEKEETTEPEPTKTDAVKIAFAKAKAYKKGLQTPQSNPNSQAGEVIEVKPVDEKEETTEPEPTKIDPVKIGFAKAKAYKKGLQSPQSNPNSQAGEAIEVKPVDVKEETTKEETTDNEAASRGEKELPTSVKLAMEKAKKYKMNKENPLPVAETEEIIKKKLNEKEELKVSKMDFIGLDFSDKKKSRGLPAGLIPLTDPFSGRDPGEVEIIVGDKTKFGDAKVSEPDSNEEDDESDMYKPKVSTWGVFPRPGNISKKYGGGRTIKPGEPLETDETKSTKEARTSELLSQYKKQTGLKVDPEIRDQCEKDMNNGDALMNMGKLKDALPFYETIMDKIPFQNELHGSAALQWSICQDSLGRQSEARIMYEKLKSHPNYRISKNAKQFLFGFQAMDMMKVKSMDTSKDNVGYENHFAAFVKNETTVYKSKVGENDDVGLEQVLPFVVALIISPVLLVLIAAFTKP